MRASLSVAQIDTDRQIDIAVIDDRQHLPEEYAWSPLRQPTQP